MLEIIENFGHWAFIGVCMLFLVLCFIGLLTGVWALLIDMVHNLQKELQELRETKNLLKKEKHYMAVEFIDKESKSGYSHDHIYQVVDLTARMKEPCLGEWYDAVIYTDGSKYFVRSVKNFYDKFKAVKE